MKFFKALWLCILCQYSFSQNLQVHYDPRGTLDPKRNSRNFPTLYFEYIKALDSSNRILESGSFFLKLQADFSGDKNNMGKFFMQVSHSFKFWKPDFFVNLQYNGGLGITEPRQYSFYILNTFSIGITDPFRWGNAYLVSVLNYKFMPYARPSHDLSYTLYWWKGLWNYKAEFAGDFSIWTENKNQGDDYTRNLKGKRFSFFAEPQFWYTVRKSLAVGTKVNLFYHVLTNDDILLIYPTLAIRYKF